MLPAIGSVSALAGQGRVGVVVSARPIGEPEDGRQLVSLRIREGERGKDAQESAVSPDARYDRAPNSSIDRTEAGRVEGGRPAAAVLPNELSPVAKTEVTRLQQRDQQVKQEEKAHAAVAGDLAGPINYVYQRGPDGRQYAVGGSVGIQTSALSGDPAEAKRQAGRMAAAANAATNPSAQDYAAARRAYALGSQLNMPLPPDERTNGVRLVL